MLAILTSIMIIKKTRWNRRIRRCGVVQTQMDVIEKRLQMLVAMDTRLLFTD